MSEKIEIDQIKSAFVSNNQEQTSVDVEKISEKLMIMIKEQDQERGTGRRTRDSRVGNHEDDRPARGHRTMNICVRCSNVRSCSANIRTREHGFKKKIKEHSNIEHANIRILANIRTFEHLKNRTLANIRTFELSNI